MQRKWLWMIAALAIVIVVAYFVLGGFHEVVLEVAEVENYTIVGNHYEGAYVRDTIARSFFQAKELLETAAVSGELAVVNFEKAVGEDSVHLFIGILLQQQALEGPKNLERRHIEGGKIVRATIESHSLVMPTREKIEQKMEVFAAENNFSLTALTIERYVSDDKLVIERFIQP